MIDKYVFALAVACITSSAFAQGDIAPSDGSVLPFPPTSDRKRRGAYAATIKDGTAG